MICGRVRDHEERAFGDDVELPRMTVPSGDERIGRPSEAYRAIESSLGAPKSPRVAFVAEVTGEEKAMPTRPKIQPPPGALQKSIWPKRLSLAPLKRSLRPLARSLRPLASLRPAFDAAKASLGGTLADIATSFRGAPRSNVAATLRARRDAIEAQRRRTLLGVAAAAALLGSVAFTTLAIRHRVASAAHHAAAVAPLVLPSAPPVDERVELLLERARGAVAEGNTARACTLYRAALGLKDDLDVRFSLAEAERAAGQIDESRASYEKVLSERPKHAAARLGLADLEWGAGKTQEATAHYRAYLELVGAGEGAERARARLNVTSNHAGAAPAKVSP